MYTSRDPRAHHEIYFALVREIVQAAPSTWAFVEVINNQILTGNLYKALKEAKKLIAYEEELFEHAKRGANLQKRSRQTSSPRDLEANLLLQAAARLQSVHDDWDKDKSQLDDALLYNRKLWSVFLSEVTDGNNPLPKDVRQNVANLGLFVMNQTVAVMSDPRPEHLGSLININREVAAGLLGRA